MFYPFKFIPLYKDYIWGGRNLEMFGRVLPNGSVAESWEVSCHPEGLSIISNGEYKGTYLHDIVQKYGSEILGAELPESNISQFPLLVKLMDAKEKLSVQVHPDDDYAFKHENGELGKNEAWYIVSASPGSKIIYDLQTRMTKEAFVKAIQKNEINKYLKEIEVFPGDVINIPAGTIHALGDGIVLAEVQQSSNTTYRIFDYNRTGKDGVKRELHLDKAVEVIDYNSKVGDEKVKGLEVNLANGCTKTYKIANKYFSIEIYDMNGEIKEKVDGSKFFIYVAVAGKGEINYEGGTMEIKAGESIFIPAGMKDFTFSGALTLIKTYVPNLENDIVLPLKSAGYTLEQIHSNISGL